MIYCYINCAKIWWLKRIQYLSCFYVSELEQAHCCVHRSCLGPQWAGFGAGARDNATSPVLFLWLQIIACISLSFFAAQWGASGPELAQNRHSTLPRSPCHSQPRFRRRVTCSNSGRVERTWAVKTVCHFWKTITTVTKHSLEFWFFLPLLSSTLWDFNRQKVEASWSLSNSLFPWIKFYYHYEKQLFESIHYKRYWFI